MIDVPLNAAVLCTDGWCGSSTRVILDPETRRVVDVVVRGPAPSRTEHVVPVAHVVASTAATIELDCTRADLARMPPFISTRYVASEVPEVGADTALLYDAMLVMRPARVPVAVERVPEGDLVVKRGMRVAATDGPVGQVGELLADSLSGEITHFTLREGHVLDRRELTLPVSAVEQADDDTLYLTLDRAAIGRLPEIPVSRHTDRATGQPEAVDRLAEARMSTPFDTRTATAIARREPSATLMAKAALTVDEVAQLFGEAPDVIREAVWQGELPAERAGEAIVAIRRADLLAWLERRGGV